MDSQRAAIEHTKAAGKSQLGPNASDNYKARLTKGLLGVGLGDGYIVEILNYRAMRVLRRELFKDSEAAKEEIWLVKEDIGTLSTIDFKRKYLQRA